MHVIIFDDLPESIRKIQMNFYCFNLSKYLKQDPFGQLKLISEKDFFPNEVCKSIDEINQGIQSVTIVLNENLNWPKVVRLSCHLRFHNYRNQSAAFPIIITFDVQPDLLKDSNTKGVGDIQNFQYEDGFLFKRFDELFEETEDEAGDRKLKFQVFYNEELIGKSFSAGKLEIIQINSKDHGDRHSIANQWGAIKLALSAGYSKEDIHYDWPPTLYFKYLLKMHESKVLNSDERKLILKETIIETKSKRTPESFLQNEKLNLSKHPYLNLKNKKILLIDDNADKGWINILNSLFSDGTENSVESREFKNVILDSKNKLNIDLNPYSLVLLDLYLPDFPNQPTKISNGFLILKQIKENFPQLPVIVFTASNKSWTLDEAIERGADGMYVKESPEYAHDKNYSKENFQSFVKTVIKVLDSYLILRPYWEKIEEIKRDFLPEINDNDTDKKFRSRIEERLEMFYGLLKRGMEQRKYDQDRFYFSDYELAFMTLWSVLNEISEAFYDKNDDSIFILKDENGKEFRCKPIPGSNWKIKESEKFLIKNEFGFEGYCEDGSPLNLIGSKNPQLKTIKTISYIAKNKKEKAYVLDQGCRVEVKSEIGSQIAFLLLNFTSDETAKTRFSKSLYYLNDIRNKLYLTHGSNIYSGFYKFTEKEKRGDSEKKIRPQHKITPKEDIKDLFELIAFLLTGKEIEVNFQY